MVDYKGKSFETPQKDLAGIINDHVMVQSGVVNSDGKPLNSGELFCVYARNNYKVGYGPITNENYPKFLRKPIIPREWTEIVDICDNPIDKDTALKIAESEAKSRGVVLYIEDSSLEKVKVLWHPNGWEPKMG